MAKKKIKISKDAFPSPVTRGTAAGTASPARQAGSSRSSAEQTRRATSEAEAVDIILGISATPDSPASADRSSAAESSAGAEPGANIVSLDKSRAAERKPSLKTAGAKTGRRVPAKTRKASVSPARRPAAAQAPRSAAGPTKSASKVKPISARPSPAARVSREPLPVGPQISSGRIEVSSGLGSGGINAAVGTSYFFLRTFAWPFLLLSSSLRILRKSS